MEDGRDVDVVHSVDFGTEEDVEAVQAELQHRHATAIHSNHLEAWPL